MKGYSLIELLAVIIVLGIIATIAYPTVRHLTKKNQERAYQSQIESLENTANTWVGSNLNKIGYDEPYYLTFDEMYQDELLDSKEVLNPKTKEPLTGCIKIEWNDSYKQHLIEYLERCPV